MNLTRNLPVLLLMGLCLGCARREDERTQESRPVARVFTDVAQAAGIRHVHQKPVLDHQLDNIMSWMCSIGAAAAAGDYNNDGWIDLYVTNSHKGTPNYLYRNNGDGTFTDIAQEAGVADLNNDGGVSLDCAWADYDNDGHVDLYVVRFGTDLLLRNNGDGTFRDVTRQSFHKRDGSAGTQWANGCAVIFFDYNLDGRLNIYVGNYFDEVDLWHLQSTLIMHDDFERARNGGDNFLYRQEPDGTFTEVATSLGLNDPGWTLAIGSADIDNDGWPDLYCANDFGPDQLFINNHDGTFRNVTEKAIGFDTKKGMSVDFGDFDNDGWLDIYVTNITTSQYLQEGNMLWRNVGLDQENTVTLTDISLEAGVYDGGWGWGAKFFDHDNDGDLDIVAANGFVSAGEGDYWYDLASWTVRDDAVADARNWPTIGDRSFSGFEPIRFWRNDGFYAFTDQANEVGLDSVRDSRGIVCFDYDNDGDLDLYVANQGQRPHLFKNAGKTANHWLEVALVVDPTTGVNRDAIGTRITIVTESGPQLRERDGGNGYCGQSDPRLHFGTGTDDRIRLLKVRWPDGGLQYLEEVAADQLVTIHQDPRRYATQTAVNVTAPKPWKPSKQEERPIPPPIPPEVLETQLSEMERLLQSASDVRALASNYRARCATYDQHDRSIKFFKQLLDEQPDDLNTALETASAYIDKTPTCGGIAAVISKGVLARKSLDHLDKAIAEHPDLDLWLAYYCRGMNHLHWPRALLHSDAAAADFRRCLELQRKDEAEDTKPYLVRPHIGLGDAYTKAEQYDSARKAWSQGLQLFPTSSELKERLAIKANHKLLEYVEAKRSLDQPIDTDLSFLNTDP